MTHVFECKQTIGAKRFLVVDDDTAMIEFVVNLLRSMGHETVGRAYDGEKAVELFERQQERIDVVLMDVMLPRRNGISAASEMRRISSAVKIVLMSGDRKNGELVSELDNVDFMEKPFKYEEIRSLIE